MNNQLYMLDIAVDKRLLANLRRTRLKMAELGLQFEEGIAILDDYNQRSRRTRLQNNRSGRL